MNDYKILISGQYNIFHEPWNAAGVYMCSGLYIPEKVKLPIYIGSSENLQIRIENKHIHYLKQNKHPHNPILQNAWNKHSHKEGFVWWLLEICETEETLEKEQIYLDIYRPFISEFGGFNIGLNATSPTKGMKGFGKDRIVSLETREKQSLAKRGCLPWNKGKSDVYSDAILQKMSDAHKGNWTGEKNPQKINPKFGDKNPHYGKKASELNKKRTKESNSKKVLCIETNQIFNSGTEASIFLNKPVGAVGDACLGRTKTCNGFHWKYVD